MLIFSLLICGCLGTSNNSSLTNYTVVFVEHNEEGTIVAGEAPLEHVVHDPGSFYYSSDLVHAKYGNSTNYVPGYPEINNSLKILLGIYYNELRQENQSGYLLVKGVYNYPYQLDTGPTILNIDKNGTLLLAYNNSSIYVKKGDAWSSPVASTRSEDYNQFYTYTDYNGTYIAKNYSYTVNWKTLWVITNIGTYSG